jgi:hypothetical protein
VYLRGETDSPEKRQRSAKSDDAQRRHAARRQMPKMPALQNRGVKQPDSERENDLNPGQWFADEKTAHQPERVKRKSQPKQPRDRIEEIGQRREMIKD